MSRLDQIHIAKPCPANWSDMEGDDKMRFCSKCRQRVFNLSEMTTAEAEELLAARDKRICVRYFRRTDGRIMTRDCPVGVKRVRTQRFAMTAGLLTFLINIAISSQVISGGSEWTTGEIAVNEPTMGKVAVPPVPNRKTPPKPLVKKKPSRKAKPSKGKR